MSDLIRTTLSNKCVTFIGTSPDMLILCSRELLQNSTMSVKVMWTLPLFPGLIEAVDHFEVTIILLDNSSQPTATVLEEYPRIVVSSQVREISDEQLCFTAMHAYRSTTETILQ